MCKTKVAFEEGIYKKQATVLAAKPKWYIIFKGWLQDRIPRELCLFRLYKRWDVSDGIPCNDAAHSLETKVAGECLNQLLGI